MLIGIGAALFTIVSVTFGQGAQGTVDRVAAQIATGIGLPPIESFFERWAHQRGVRRTPGRESDAKPYAAAASSRRSSASSSTSSTDATG
jgi:hypothetical protein